RRCYRRAHRPADVDGCGGRWAISVEPVRQRLPGWHELLRLPKGVEARTATPPVGFGTGSVAQLLSSRDFLRQVNTNSGRVVPVLLSAVPRPRPCRPLLPSGPGPWRRYWWRESHAGYGAFDQTFWCAEPRGWFQE